MESMGYLPCFSMLAWGTGYMLAWGNRLHGKQGENMDSMGSETMEFHGFPWKSMGKIPRKSIGAKNHGKHGVLTMLFHASMGKTITWKKHGESMDSMGSETTEFHGIHRNPWKTVRSNFSLIGA